MKLASQSMKANRRAGEGRTAPVFPGAGSARPAALKVLLTQPLISSRHIAGPFKLGHKTNTFLYGQAILAAVAREGGHEVYALDPHFEQMDARAYRAFLREHRFDVVGCTVFTLTFPPAHALFRITREILPGALTVAGGPHPTSLPARTLEEIPELDCVVVGEGERTWVELLDRRRRGEPLDGVAGLALRAPDNGRIVVNPARPLIANLDELPMPAYDLFPISEYVATPNLVRRYPTVMTQVTRGCPYECAFCEYNLALGRKYRHRSAGQVVAELQHLKQHYGARGLVFRDSTLTVNVRFLRTLCEEMIRHRLELSWMCYSRADVLARRGDELLPLMKRAGCWQIGIGCESANQKSLDLLRKGTTVEQNVAAVSKTIHQGIMCSTTWIIGLPGEDWDDAWTTVELATRLGSHVAKFFLPLPYPGTELERICRADGGLRANAAYDDYEFYAPNDPVYVNLRIGKQGMRRLLKKAYLKFYSNPRVVWRNLRQLTDWNMVRKYWSFARLLR